MFDNAAFNIFGQPNGHLCFPPLFQSLTGDDDDVSQSQVLELFILAGAHS